MSDIIELAQQYLDFAKNEVGATGKRRADTTMTSYRRAIEGFTAAVVNSGRALDALPADFIQTSWMETQISVHHQPIQLRVRVAAVKHFINWLRARNIVVAPCDLPIITTTPKKEPPPMSDITYLTDQNQLDPVPAAPPQVQLPQAAVQPPPPAAPRPVPKRTNPLANLLPQGGGFKLRVRREREGDDPSFIGDFPAEQVAATGAVESFLQRVVGPRMVAQNITGDVTFQLSALSPGTGTNGPQEGERSRLTVSVGGPMPTTTTAPAVAASVVGGAPSAQQELMETVNIAQRAQEELANTITKHLKEKPVPQNTEEMSELKSMVASLASSVSALARQVESAQFSAERERPMPMPQANDTLGVINAVASVFKNAAPAQQPPMSMEGMFAMMAKAKDVFAPQNVSIDTSPLEDQIAELKQRLGKDDLLSTMTKFKQLKELFQEVGGEKSAPQPTGLGAALGNLLTQVVSNPEPIAAAAERVLGALAVARGVADPKPPSQQKPQLPPELLTATKELMETSSPEAAVGAAHEWLTQLQRVPQTQGAAGRLIVLMKEGKTTELGIFLRQVATMLGFKEQATADRCANIAKAVVAQVQNHEAEEEPNDEQTEEQGQADLNIRVGGVRAGAEEDADDGDEEAEGEEGEEAEEAEGAEDVAGEEADAPDDEGAAPAEGAEDVAPPVPDDFDAVVAATPMPSKRGRKARKQQAATPPPVIEPEATDTTTPPVF